MECQLQGHRLEGEQGTAGARLEVSGSPRYGAPVTTGHDKQQQAAQAHGQPDRGNASSAQVLFRCENTIGALSMT